MNIVEVDWVFSENPNLSVLKQFLTLEKNRIALQLVDSFLLNKIIIIKKGSIVKNCICFLSACFFVVLKKLGKVFKKGNL